MLQRRLNTGNRVRRIRDGFPLLHIWRSALHRFPRLHVSRLRDQAGINSPHVTRSDISPTLDRHIEAGHPRTMHVLVRQLLCRTDHSLKQEIKRAIVHFSSSSLPSRHPSRNHSPPSTMFDVQGSPLSLELRGPTMHANPAATFMAPLHVALADGVGGRRAHRDCRRGRWLRSHGGPHDRTLARSATIIASPPEGPHSLTAKGGENFPCGQAAVAPGTPPLGRREADRHHLAYVRLIPHRPWMSPAPIHLTSSRWQSAHIRCGRLMKATESSRRMPRPRRPPGTCPCDQACTG